mgnify:CR=1 FL=1
MMRAPASARRTATARPRRGFALLSVILVSVVATTLALALGTMAMSNHLIQGASEKAMTVDDVALSGLEVARARLNAKLDSVPSVGYATIEDGVMVSVGGRAITRSTWVARLGNSDSLTEGGEYGVQAEVISRSVDAGGNAAVRRALMYQQSFARYAYFSDIGLNSNGSILWFANGWTAQGPLHSNDSLYIWNGSYPQAIFRDEVTTAKGIENKSKGWFLKPPPREGVARIELPSTAELNQLKAIANRAGYVFTPTFETGDTATVTMRIEFVAIDVNGDGDNTDEDEGFFRVYQMDASMPNGNGWAMGRVPAPPTSGVPVHNGAGGVTRDSVLYSPNCGVTTTVGGVMRTPTTFADIGIAGGSNYRNRMRPKQDAFDHANARCFLGGDPRLTPTGVFQPNDPAGAWLPRTSGTIPGSIAGRADANYLWPLAPIYNPDFRGVMFVEGRVGISGTVRGRLTLASRDNMVVLHELRQAVDPSTTNGMCRPEDDIVGLLSGRHVLWADNMLQTPLQRRDNSSNGSNWAARKDFDPAAARPDMAVHAVILALGSIGTERPSPPSGTAASAFVNRGTIRQVGGRIQDRAGQGGTISSGFLHGYLSDITFNKCALRFPPPYFPTTGHWARGQFFEIDPTRFSPSTWFGTTAP